MAKGSTGKFVSDSAYNQCEGKQETPERDDPYNTWTEILANHGADHDNAFLNTVNSDSGDIMGHGAPGELHDEPSSLNPPDKNKRKHNP